MYATCLAWLLRLLPISDWAPKYFLWVHTFSWLIHCKRNNQRTCFLKVIGARSPRWNRHFGAPFTPARLLFFANGALVASIFLFYCRVFQSQPSKSARSLSHRKNAGPGILLCFWGAARAHIYIHNSQEKKPFTGKYALKDFCFASMECRAKSPTSWQAAFALKRKVFSLWCLSIPRTHYAWAEKEIKLPLWQSQCNYPDCISMCGIANASRKMFALLVFFRASNYWWGLQENSSSLMAEIMIAQADKRITNWFTKLTSFLST